MHRRVAHTTTGTATPRISRESVVAWALGRQHLTLESAGEDVLSAMDDILGLHATVPLSSYLQLRARVRDFTPARLDSLLDDGRAAKVGCMRRTLFIESAALIPLVLAATRELSARPERYLEANGFTVDRYERLAERIERALTGRAMTARELNALLGERLSPVLLVMCDESRLIRWKSTPEWRAPPAYRLFKEALPDVRLGTYDEPTVVSQLVERYVRRYGPVTESDIAWWTGLRRTRIRAAVASLPTLQRVDVDGLDGAFLIHADDVNVAREAPAPADALSLLPVLDPLLQSHADRSRYVDAAHLPYVVDRGGNATSVIVARGHVIGVWDCVGKPAHEMRLLFFNRPSAPVRRRARQAAVEVGQFLAGYEPAVVECDRMAPLTQGTGAFLSPLRHAR